MRAVWFISVVRRMLAINVGVLSIILKLIIDIDMIWRTAGFNSISKIALFPFLIMH
jgi:hypothetical protein